MTDFDNPVGHVTIRVPIFRHTCECTSEEGQETWLAYGTAELVSHDIKIETLAELAHTISDGDMMADFEMPTELTELANEAHNDFERVNP